MGARRAELSRDTKGVVHIRGAGLGELLWGLGYAHAMDRGLQLLLMRLLGRGQASEYLDASDETLAIDLFFRRMGWAAGEPPEPPSTEAAALAEAYCDGVNARLERRLPWELRLRGYRPDPWRPEDCLLLARMTGYLTLAQSQFELERLVVEMVQAGIDRPRLEALFPGQLEGLEEDLVRRLRLGQRVVPEQTRWGAALPRPVASNSWVVSGDRTASGAPILANDPHLEGNRLPNVWYEAVLEAPDRWLLGATMPGLPGVLVGRTPELAWGATYTFMDAVDSWIEDCRDGAHRRDGAQGPRWVPFRQRRELIRRRGRPDHVEVFHENGHGVLDGDPAEPGLYLATRWSGAEAGWASLEGMLGLWRARDVEQGRACLGRLEVGFNWVLADRDGHIGYQMSGLAPRRNPGRSGLVPRLGWDPADDWQGFHPPEDLPRALDPDCGFFVTANDDLNRHGRVAPITVSMGPYRATRIAQALESRDDWSLEATQQLQLDVRSLQAERFLDALRPLLPDTPNGRRLAAWDGRYDAGSRAAALFEDVYRELLRAVFAGGGFGPAWQTLCAESSVLADFYHRFDDVLLDAGSPWYAGRHRDGLWREALQVALDGEPEPLGRRNRLRLAHILLGGRLPRWLGFDRGPLSLPGGRASIRQAQLYRARGRPTSFVPSYRTVTDMAGDVAYTALLGGPSDRRFSRWYASEIGDWAAGRYKPLAPSS